MAQPTTTEEMHSEAPTPPVDPSRQQHRWGEWVPPEALHGGPEMAALRRFLFSCTWTGTVHAGGMGPGSPEMQSPGKGTVTSIMDGAWLVGEFEQDQFVDGEVIIHWQAHYVAGWDPRVREYRVAVVDNTGTAGLMRGWVEGNRFVTQLPGDSPVQLRMAWELLGDGTVKWTNESSANDGPWFLIEDYICVPA